MPNRWRSCAISPSVRDVGVDPQGVRQAGERELAAGARVAPERRPSRRARTRQRERPRRRPRVGPPQRLRDPPAVVAGQRQRRVADHRRGQPEHAPRGSGDLALVDIENTRQLLERLRPCLHPMRSLQVRQPPSGRLQLGRRQSFEGPVLCARHLASEQEDEIVHRPSRPARPGVGHPTAGSCRQHASQHLRGRQPPTRRGRLPGYSHVLGYPFNRSQGHSCGHGSPSCPGEVLPGA